MAATLEEPSLFTPTTVAGLGACIAIAFAGYFISLRSLPANTSTTLKAFYIWHVSDAMVHLSIEASWLYNCFFTFTQLPIHTSDFPHPAALTSNPVYFLGRSDRSYGPHFGTNPSALLWHEYAKADKRWGGADLGLVSLELLTVFLGGPIAIYVSEQIRKGAGSPSGGAASAKMWFWGSLLATGELYGGFMTFAPEWLSGNPNLDSSSFIKM